MKLILSLFVLTCFYTTQIKAQSKTPKWMCGKGFWVIESNVHTPKKAIIYFYTNEHELVYKEEVEGISINTDRIKTRKHLEAVLHSAITAWQKDGVVKENQQLVIVKR
jgi:hypothetical protein